MWQTIIHVVFLLSAMAIAMTDKLMQPPPGPHALKASARPTICSGRTHSSNCSAVTWPDASAASRRLVPSLCAFLAICAALS